jgi:hypothetical protein
MPVKLPGRRCPMRGAKGYSFGTEPAGWAVLNEAATAGRKTLYTRERSESGPFWHIEQRKIYETLTRPSPANTEHPSNRKVLLEAVRGQPGSAAASTHVPAVSATLRRLGARRARSSMSTGVDRSRPSHPDEVCAVYNAGDRAGALVYFCHKQVDLVRDKKCLTQNEEGEHHGSFLFYERRSGP